jgi:hypothetical protein
MLFLSTHTSHVLQSLDFECFFNLKIAYRRLLSDYSALTNIIKIKKANFLEFYAKAQEISL